MTLILSGTDGLSDVDGSAATPAIRGTDTNTGIFFPAADTIAFSEGGVESMRIDSSGNVGIGTNSPTAKLDVVGASGASIIYSRVTGTTSADSAQMQCVNGSVIFQAYAYSSGAEVAVGSASNHPLTFRTNATERMRIDSSGNVGIGTNAPTQKLNVRGGRSVFQANSDLFSIQIEGGAGGGQYYIGATNEASPSLVFSNVGGAERMRITSAGLVGIGRTPAYSLDVNGTVNGTIFASWNNTFAATSGGAAASFGNIGLFYVYWQNAGFTIFGSDVVLCNIYAGATVIASNAYTGGGAAPTRTYSSSPYLAVSFTGAGGPWSGHYTLIQ